MNGVFYFRAIPENLRYTSKKNVLHSQLYQNNNNFFGAPQNTIPT